MIFDPDVHRRRSLRLHDFDYASAGACFVTTCVQGREALFGDVVDGEMVLSAAGRMVEEMWRSLPVRFPTMTLDDYVVMPDHFHGIIFIDNACDVGAPLAAPKVLRPTPRQLARINTHGDDTNPGAASSANDQGAASSANDQGAASSAPTLGMIVRAFKSISAIAVNRHLDRTGQPLWQRNYFERIIRDDGELRRLRDYVAGNPGRRGEGWCR